MSSPIVCMTNFTPPGHGHSSTSNPSPPTFASNSDQNINNDSSSHDHNNNNNEHDSKTTCTVNHNHPNTVSTPNAKLAHTETGVTSLRRQVQSQNLATNSTESLHTNPEVETEYWHALKKAVVEGKKVKLVPYQKHHVKTYNAWLNDPYIQQMTQTEPYSLEQEYEFQKEWNDSETKYIFIILDKTLDPCDPPMAGDINLFIQEECAGELNIMVAEPKSRRKGLATECLQLILQWARKSLDIKKFVAKIQHDNKGSIELFKSLGFAQTDYVETFKEFTFTLILEDSESETHSLSPKYDANDGDDSDDGASGTHGQKPKYKAAKHYTD